MDPRHRDRVAFVRICSGRFERGMRVDNARTGRTLALSFAHEVFGQDRAVLDEAFPGDVVGVVIGGDVRVGDTLYVGPDGALPADPDAHARVVRDRSPTATSTRHKQFRRGLEQLDQEGVVHVLRREHTQDPVPVLAGVGPMQFEVAVERLKTEFGADVTHAGAAVDGRAAHRRRGRGQGARRPRPDRRLRPRRRHPARGLPEPLRARALRPATTRRSGSSA